MPSRTIDDVEPAPGQIFWLPSNAETQAIPDIEVGRLDHPVLILTSGSTHGLSTDRNIQVLIITSFGKQLLEDKFPNAARQSQQRARYIPIGRSPEWSAPHPDTGMLLKLRITGNPSAPGNGRQSYVGLESPSLVAKHHLRPLFDGTARLTTKSLVQVVDMLNEMNCTATITLPVKTTPSRAPSRPQRADTSSHYSNATYAQPPRDPPRVPPRVPPRPQRAESSSQYYGNIPPPRGPPRAPPRPQPAGGDGNRKNEEESTFSMGDVLWLGAAAIVVVKVGLKVFFGR